MGASVPGLRCSRTPPSPLRPSLDKQLAPKRLHFSPVLSICLNPCSSPRRRPRAGSSGLGDRLPPSPPAPPRQRTPVSILETGVEVAALACRQASPGRIHNRASLDITGLGQTVIALTVPNTPAGVPAQSCSISVVGFGRPSLHPAAAGSRAAPLSAFRPQHRDPRPLLALLLPALPCSARHLVLVHWNRCLLLGQPCLRSLVCFSVLLP